MSSHITLYISRFSLTILRGVLHRIALKLIDIKEFLIMLTHFTGNITNLEAGQILVIVGKTTDAASRLDLSLKSSKADDENIALNFSVRFMEKCIVRNSCENGEWGIEEREENLYDCRDDVLNPISPGEIFKIYILVGDQQFHIGVNNQPYCRYAYRLSIESIRTIQLKYDLQFVTQIDHRSIFPFPHPPVQYDDTRNIFSNDFPKRFKYGHVIVITGIPYGNPKGWFQIKFTEAASKRQALHLSTRFEPHFTVVRTSMNENCEYGPEERSGGFPFVLDQQFRLAIAFTPKEIIFAVDGSFFASFTHRSENGIDKLNGFKMGTSYGLFLEISAVDHVQLGSTNCDGFEQLSHPDYEIQ